MDLSRHDTFRPCSRDSSGNRFFFILTGKILVYLFYRLLNIRVSGVYAHFACEFFYTQSKIRRGCADFTGFKKKIGV